MRGRRISLSRPRRFLVDMLHFAARIPTIPVQRRMALAEVAAARENALDRPCWPAVFLKAYSQVADDFPPLRRAYVGLPWPHLREYPTTVASVAFEREYQGEPCVFFGRIGDPSKQSLRELHSRIRWFAETPIESVKSFKQMLSFAALPRPIRRALLWTGLNLPRTRPGKFGTFGLSVYSSLGAESLHPLSPMTTTLTYGCIGDDGKVSVRLIYDHRVLDGANVARALGKLDEKLNGPILAELRGLGVKLRVVA